MRSLSRFKLLGLAMVLIALLKATGGLVISQAAGGRAVQRPRSISPRSKDVGHWTLDRFKAEVFDLGGKRLFDSGPVMGNALDWTMTTEAGEQVAHGVYLSSAQFSDPRG